MNRAELPRFEPWWNKCGCVQRSRVVILECYVVTFGHAGKGVCMRLFVMANSLIPQHVPETCNRCL